MFGIFFIIFMGFIVICYSDNPPDNMSFINNNQLETISYEKSGRFFPFFSVVRFANSDCSGSNSFNGTCFTKRECFLYNGTASGTCANGLGVCCTFKKTCGTTTSVNNTYFVNPGYYSSYSGGERCLITVYPCNSDICQLKIDFLDFSLSQPNASGICDNDFLLISGGATNVPRICGENNLQHVYVEFNRDNPITLSIDTNVDYTFDRKWNLRIQQIACDSPWRAPNGCLQYYKTISGTVSSFNYGSITNPRTSSILPFLGTRQMQNLNYGVCIRMVSGYCSIEWSQADANSFTVSGDSGIIDSTPGIDYSYSGELCDHNYLIIPNPSVNGTLYTTDRFCGNGFQTKTSSSKPFVLYVVTNRDPNENIIPGTGTAVEPDLENRGFLLKYRQLACTV